MNCFVKKYTAVLAVALATCFTTTLQADDNFQSNAEFDEWALFQDDGACWVASNPVFISK